jgi:hypothetical protein
MSTGGRGRNRGLGGPGILLRSHWGDRSRREQLEKQEKKRKRSQKDLQRATLYTSSASIVSPGIPIVKSQQ